MPETASGIYFHTILSFKDIIEIEDIWIEVILAIQNHNIIRRRK